MVCAVAAGATANSMAITQSARTDVRVMRMRVMESPRSSRWGSRERLVVCVARAVMRRSSSRVGCVRASPGRRSRPRRAASTGRSAGSRQLISPSRPSGSWKRTESIGPSAADVPLERPRRAGGHAALISAASSATVKPRWSSRPRSNIAGLKPCGVGSYPGTSKTCSMTSPAARTAWRGVARAGAEDDGRLEADGVLVEGAEAVEIAGHHRDVADAARRAHRAGSRVGSPRPEAFTGMERIRSVRISDPWVRARARRRRSPPSTTARPRAPGGRCSGRRCGPTRRGARRAAGPGRRRPRSRGAGCATTLIRARSASDPVGRSRPPRPTARFSSRRRASISTCARSPPTGSLAASASSTSACSSSRRWRYARFAWASRPGPRSAATGVCVAAGELDARRPPRPASSAAGRAAPGRCCRAAGRRPTVW